MSALGLIGDAKVEAEPEEDAEEKEKLGPDDIVNGSCFQFEKTEENLQDFCMTSDSERDFCDVTKEASDQNLEESEPEFSHDMRDLKNLQSSKNELAKSEEYEKAACDLDIKEECLEDFPLMVTIEVGDSLGRKKRKKVLKKPKPKKEVKSYPCDFCIYVATKSSELRSHMNSQHGGYRYPCDRCDFVATQPAKLKKHKEAIHEGIRYPCDLCDYTATHLVTLKRHKKTKHEGFTTRFLCDQCDFVTFHNGHLKRHKQTKHEGVRFHCDQCSYAATKACDLTRHSKSRHQGVRYPCDGCDLVFTDAGNLVRHKKAKHDGVRYYCDQCGYSAGQAYQLKKHIEGKH